jgi:hypothetical protein
MKRQITAFSLAVVFASGLALQPALLAGAQGPGSISGTADKEAKKPYPDYSVRARSVLQGVVAAITPLDAEGKFALAGIDAGNYLVELINKDGKVVCTEGPFDLAKQPQRTDVKIQCGNPAAWWLLAAAGAAGITTGVVANDPASASR